MSCEITKITDAHDLTERTKDADVPEQFNKNSKAIKDLIDYFKTDAQPFAIEVDSLKDIIFQEIFGFDCFSYIVQRLNKKKLKVHLGERKGTMVLYVDSCIPK